MKLPKNAPSVDQSGIKMAMEKSVGITPSVNWGCWLNCGAALAKCLFAEDKVACLVQNGASNCIKCI